MILGVGIDLVEHCRVERELAAGKWAETDGVFTREEITYCSAGVWPARRYAAFFAAKEATLKALGLAVPDTGIYRDIEVFARTGDQHEIVLHNRAQAEFMNRGGRHIRLSVGSTREQAGAMVIVEA